MVAPENSSFPGQPLYVKCLDFVPIAECAALGHCRIGDAAVVDQGSGDSCGCCVVPTVVAVAAGVEEKSVATFAVQAKRFLMLWTALYLKACMRLSPQLDFKRDSCAWRYKRVQQQAALSKDTARL